MNETLTIIEKLNTRLSQDNFCLPLAQYLNSNIIRQYDELKDNQALIDNVLLLTMSLDQRVMQIISRYDHIQYFQCIHPFILSSLQSYYLAEYPVAQITLYFCIESILQQWLSSKNIKLNNQNDWKKWEETWSISINNAPTNHIKELLHIYKTTCDDWIKNFFSSTLAGISGFNRNEPAHFLHKVPVDQKHIARMFLFLDMIAELIYCQEKGYDQISKLTYFDSAIEEVPEKENTIRLAEYNSLKSHLQYYIQAQIFIKANITLNSQNSKR